VLLGSTQKMGVGTNVQDRLVALHHLDAPWRPADIEQREGRILRQGNQNDAVDILRYVTEGSFDVYMWQTLERKAAFIGQVMTGTVNGREVEEISDTALSFAEVKALATGNPLVLEKADIDTQVARLTRLRTAHERERARLRFTERDLLRRADALDDRAVRLDDTAAGRIDTRGDKFTMTIDRHRLRDRADAGRRLREHLASAAGAAEKTDRDVTEPVGTLGGYPLHVRASRFRLAKIAVVVDCPARLTVELERRELPEVNPRQLVQRLERALQRVEDLAADARRTAQATRAEAAQAASRREQPFEHTNRLRTLQARQQQIERELTPNEPADTGLQPAAAPSVGLST
jgi:hypothetical protein